MKITSVLVNGDFPAQPVWVVTAPNPGPKTLDGTNLYVIGIRPAYIVDPGPLLPDFQHTVAKWIRSNGLRAEAILLTHGHPDHAPGSRILSSELGVPVWGSREMYSTHAHFRPDRTFESAQVFPLEGDALAVISTPGHSEDHVAFWLQHTRILFVGDTILGLGSTVIAPPEGDMAKYMWTLGRLLDLHASVIAPGHGPLITDPDRKIDEYIRHRLDREIRLLRCLADGPATAPELVSLLYADTDPRLRDLALGSVRAQLVKLEKEGRVKRAGDQFALI